MTCSTAEWRPLEWLCGVLPHLTPPPPRLCYLGLTHCYPSKFSGSAWPGSHWPPIRGFSGGQCGVTKNGLDTKPDDMGSTELNDAGHVT